MTVNYYILYILYNLYTNCIKQKMTLPGYTLIYTPVNKLPVRIFRVGESCRISQDSLKVIDIIDGHLNEF